MVQSSVAATLSNLAQPLGPVAHRLEGLLDGILSDLGTLERELEELFTGQPPGLARACARHLLSDRGKRVRPFLCLLAARHRRPHASPSAACLLARAAELVHSSTLLHDDVIDFADTRRGRPAARMLYGNASSVLGGDLLLVEALSLIEAAGVPACRTSILGVLRRMVDAESAQLELRGRTDFSIDDYFRICLGKTASLFEWVMEAGAHAGGAAPGHVEALGRYGRELGVAFQLMDDLLDLTGDARSVGKAVMQDIRQGTITYPAISALREEPALATRLRNATDEDIAEMLGAEMLAAVDRHGGLGQARLQIALHTRRARSALSELPKTKAVNALDSVANELAERTR